MQLVFNCDFAGCFRLLLLVAQINISPRWSVVFVGKFLRIFMIVKKEPRDNQTKAWSTGDTKLKRTKKNNSDNKSVRQSVTRFIKFIRMRSL